MQTLRAAGLKRPYAMDGAAFMPAPVRAGRAPGAQPSASPGIGVNVRRGHPGLGRDEHGDVLP
jgi:hypothetical protein